VIHLGRGRQRGPGAGGLRGLGPVWPAGGPRGEAFPDPGTGVRVTGGAAVPPVSSRWRRALAKGSPLRHMDWVLALTVLALSLLGTLLVWSATEPGLRAGGANPQAFLDKQLLNVVIGVALMAVVSLVDYRALRIWAPAVYGVSCLGLLAVLTPVGTTVNGARAWIALPGGFQIEPSEYAKLGLVLLIAVIFTQARDRIGEPGPRQVLMVLGVSLPAFVMVVAEPALGVTIVLLAVTVGMIVLSGLKLRWVAVLAASGAAGVFAVVSLHLLKAYQVERLTAFLNPSASPLGAGYSAAQAKIAIGSGGMFGQGLFHGQLVAGNFVPSQQTDFIFTVAGEELGFAGTIAIIALLGVLIFRSLRIAARADDMFGLLVASGIGIWFAVQAFINIGMTIGIAPVTGIPLPFVSYGGSALFADMIAVGVLQAVHRRHQVFG
jgi:rod shape determining protein RodA